MLTDLDMVLRLILSCLLGGVVGYERQSRNKAAGLRTHILVSLGSCLIMILSLMVYGSVQGLTNADPARLAAQVVSGIGFLGAGQQAGVHRYRPDNRGQSLGCRRDRIGHRGRLLACRRGVNPPGLYYPDRPGTAGTTHQNLHPHSLPARFPDNNAG